MSRAIRAIYEDGHLRLLDPVELVEGEYVDVTIAPSNADALTDAQRMRAALGSAVCFPAPRREGEEIEPEWIPLQLDNLHEGELTTSEYIIQERREGP